MQDNSTTTVRKVARPTGNSFAGSVSTTARSSAKFSEVRRNRIATPSTLPQTGSVTALKDAAPGILLIGVALAEAIFLEPIRSLKRKFRGNARAA